MSRRQRMPQKGSRKWSRIAHHKRTHMYRPSDVGLLRKHWIWGWRWLNDRCADNPRWAP